MSHVRDRISKELYEDLYNRRKTVREVAKTLGLAENYLSRAIPERAPRRNPRLLIATRRLYQNQIASEVIAGKHSVQQGADLANITVRTMFRRMKVIRDALKGSKS